MTYSVRNVLTLNMQTPHEMSEKRLSLAEEYSRYSGEYAKLVKIQADHFNTFRGEFKSDNACQKSFDVTPEGVQMVILKMKLKSIEKTMSALNTHLRLLENEAHNIY